jgi:hypothetical protein
LAGNLPHRDALDAMSREQRFGNAADFGAGRCHLFIGQYGSHEINSVK